MLEYDKIDISEGIDSNKYEETSRRCSLCKFYYFLDKSVSYGPFLCNGCYDMSLKVCKIKLLLIIMEIIIVLISRLLVKKMRIISLKMLQ